MIATETWKRTFTTPKGRPVTLQFRPGTNDENVCLALTQGDEYGMAKRELTGWLIDVGAHIGALAIPAALDNPGLQVVAIEAVPENCDIIEEAIALNGVEGRVHLVRAAAGRPGQSTVSCHWGYRHHESADDGYLEQHRFVGNTWVDLGEPEFGGDLTAISLDDVLAMYGIEDAFLKIDAEGAEWDVLDTSAVAKLHTITGEYHGGYSGHPAYHGGNAARDIVVLLSPTHDVTLRTPDEPIIGLFDAVRHGR